MQEKAENWCRERKGQAYRNSICHFLQYPRRGPWNGTHNDPAIKKCAEIGRLCLPELFEKWEIFKSPGRFSADNRQDFPITEQKYIKVDVWVDGKKAQMGNTGLRSTKKKIVCLHVVCFPGFSVIMMRGKTKAGKLKVKGKRTGDCPITQSAPPMWLTLFMSMDVGTTL